MSNNATGVEYPATRVDESAIPAIERCDVDRRCDAEPPDNRASWRTGALSALDRYRRDAAPSALQSSEAYYTTLYHELTHATGHKSRLNRNGIAEPSRFGSQSYAREELVAEMGAAFLCGHTGIDPATIEQSASYVDSWLRRLRDDRKLVVTAAAQAQKRATTFSGARSAIHPESDGEA
jgi:antirestriction protein ArdC